MNYLTEAFKQMELLESEKFTFDKDGAAKLANFLDDDMAIDFETIIDPEAETKEELKSSYMGNVICRCPICRSLIYREPEDIVIDEEEQLANIEEDCPYCFEAGGFEIIGQVAPFKEVTVEGADEGTKVEVDGQEVETTTTDDGDTDPETEEDREEVLEEALSNSEKLFRAFPELRDGANDVKSSRHARDNEDLEDSQRFPVEGTKQRSLVERRCAKRRHTRDNEDLEDSQRYPIESPVGTKGLKEGVEEDKEESTLKDKKRRHTRDDEDLEDSQRYPIESPAPAQTGLREGMEDISITTDDQVIKVKATPREDKETIQPVEEETKEVIEEVPTIDEEETPTADAREDELTSEEDFNIEDFDEESFDTLGESYLKNVYENVNSFKTLNVQSHKDSIIVEGVIAFNSGKKAKTKFLFEAKDATKNGRLRFSGLNENISKNKKAFTLTGFLKEGRLISESLNYNYSAKLEKGKSKRLYGTIRL